MKKALILFLCFAMLAGVLLCGCAGDKPGAAPATDGAVTDALPESGTVPEASEEGAGKALCIGFTWPGEFGWIGAFSPVAGGKWRRTGAGAMRASLPTCQRKFAAAPQPLCRREASPDASGLCCRVRLLSAVGG
jgi:hypothetical protein